MQRLKSVLKCHQKFFVCSLSNIKSFLFWQLFFKFSEISDTTILISTVSGACKFAKSTFWLEVIKNNHESRDVSTLRRHDFHNHFRWQFQPKCNFNKLILLLMLFALFSEFTRISQTRWKNAALFSSGFSSFVSTTNCGGINEEGRRPWWTGWSSIKSGTTKETDFGDTV